MLHAANAMKVNVEKCILVEIPARARSQELQRNGSVYFCADPHNKPIDHPNVTTFYRRRSCRDCKRAGGDYALFEYGWR